MKKCMQLAFSMLLLVGCTGSNAQNSLVSEVEEKGGEELVLTREDPESNRYYVNAEKNNSFLMLTFEYDPSDGHLDNVYLRYGAIGTHITPIQDNLDKDMNRLIKYILEWDYIDLSDQVIKQIINQINLTEENDYFSIPFLECTVYYSKPKSKVAENELNSAEFRITLDGEK